jgi:hypothetical protein
VLFTPLDAPDIIRVQVSLFGKPLLAQMQTHPLFADGGTKNDAVIRRRHSL